MITCLSGLPTSARRIPHTTVRIGYVAVLISCFGCVVMISADSAVSSANIYTKVCTWLYMVVL